jgi:serine/threonine protein kinase
VFEPLGQSLYEFLKANDYIPFPLYCVQDFSRQMLEAIDFLHSMKLVPLCVWHTLS